VIEVRRDHLITDTLHHLDGCHPHDLRKQLRVKFVGEDGIDEGGLQKEFFQLIMREIFSPKYGIFRDYENGCFWFRPMDNVMKDLEAECKLVGQLVGLALYNSALLDIRLPLGLYMQIIGKTPGLDALTQLDQVSMKMDVPKSHNNC
jgi:ubiquitin-protein ligase E3 A